MEQRLSALELRLAVLESLVHPLPEPLRRRRPDDCALNAIAFLFLSVIASTLATVTAVLLTQTSNTKYWMVGLMWHWCLFFSASWCVLKNRLGCRKNTIAVLMMVGTTLYVTALVLLDHLDFANTREQNITVTYAFLLGMCFWAYCKADVPANVRAEGQPVAPQAEPLLPPQIEGA